MPTFFLGGGVCFVKKKILSEPFSSWEWVGIFLRRRRRMRRSSSRSGKVEKYTLDVIILM